MTEHETALVEVGVFGHNGESLLQSMAPHGFIGGFAQADLTHVLGIRILSLQSPDESIGKVVIEQQLHCGRIDTSLRSLSAAKAKQARMSSWVKSGKSVRIASSLMPEARYSSTSETVMRRLRMHGLPPRLAGSMVMRSW